jgi:ceramide glucosyltransferase
LPLALLLVAVYPAGWYVLVLTILIRGIAAHATSAWILKQPTPWILLPFQDLLSFLFWIAGFFGNTIVWRGKRYYLKPDGRFVPVA